MKKLFSILILVFIVSTLVGVMWLFNLLDYRAPQSKTVYFEQGSSVRKMASRLEQEKLIANRHVFEALIRLQKKEKLIKSGEYEFAQGMKIQAILDLMVKGKVKMYPVTIPEGFNLTQIGAILVKKNLMTEEHWQVKKQDVSLLSDLGVKVSSLEGYLFPDTYMIEKRTTGDDLVQSMVELFRSKISEDDIKLAQEKGLSLNQWVTLASIIEKETGVAEERPLIASVFLNRLQKGMLLQTDPTVIYGIKNFNGNLTKKDLETDTPYNTYTRPGLPPAPICSPGYEALQAVLHPAQEDYLYFVAKGDGSHHFSKTLDEHNQGVQYYQLKRGNAPDSGE